MLKWSRVELYLTVLTCKGLFETIGERIQFAPTCSKLVTLRTPERDCTAPQGGIHPVDDCLSGKTKKYDYCGAVHIHSTYSDGAGTVAQIAEAANHAGVDFVILCDHFNLDARKDGEDGWRGKSLFIIGTEITTDMGHLLALDVPDDFLPAPHDSIAAQQHILDHGGIGYIALPCDLKDHWRDFNKHNRRIGLEVFNLSAIARTKLNIPALGLILSRYRSKKRQRAFSLVAARPAKEMRLWDSMMMPKQEGEPYQPVVGIGSLDAHAVMKFGGQAYNLPSYEEVFQTLRTHVVLDTSLHGANREDGTSVSCSETDEDIASVHTAFAKGHIYIAYDNYANAAGFHFYARHKTQTNQCIAMGDVVTYEKDALSLNVELPRQKSFLKLYRDGKLVGCAKGSHFEYKVDQPGAYRVEAFLYRFRIGSLYFGVYPWIFSNPIYVQPIR